MVWSPVFNLKKQTKKADNRRCPLQKGGILESLMFKALTASPFFIQEKIKNFKPCLRCHSC
jgi:hypothetical protein